MDIFILVLWLLLCFLGPRTYKKGFGLDIDNWEYLTKLKETSYAYIPAMVLFALIIAPLTVLGYYFIELCLAIGTAVDESYRTWRKHLAEKS